MRAGRAPCDGILCADSRAVGCPVQALIADARVARGARSWGYISAQTRGSHIALRRTPRALPGADAAIPPAPRQIALCCAACRFNHGASDTSRARAPWEPGTAGNRALYGSVPRNVAGTRPPGRTAACGIGDAYLRRVQALKNIEAGARPGRRRSFADVGRTRMYVTDIADWEGGWAGAREVFGTSGPASRSGR